MRKIIFSIFFCTLLYFFLPSSTSFAATLYTGDTVTIDQNTQGLSNIYVFGEDIQVDAPVENDVVFGGGNVTISGDTTGSIQGGGGNITISSNVGNTMRIAGGDIVISGPVKRDVIVAGGNITITKEATISGDLVFIGGKLLLQAPVKGNVTVQGGEAYINSRVGKSVGGNIGIIEFGSNAEVNGDLTYTYSEKSTINESAKIIGEQTVRKVEQTKRTPRDTQPFFTAGSFYKLTVDILVGLFLVYLLTKLVESIAVTTLSSPLQNLGTGFATLFLMPLAAVFLLILIWPGFIAFLIYGLLLILNLFFGKVIIGWLLLRWWYGRKKHTYHIDWKAAMLGPVVMLILFLIPVFGWITMFIFYVMTLGAMMQQLFLFVASQRMHLSSKTKK